jgi:hypothetical protein
MTPDDLERQLQRRTLKTLSPDWRAEILSAAYVARAESVAPEPARRAWWLRHGAGWPALAAVWMVIAILHFANTESDPKAPVAAVSSEALDQHWREEQRWLVELTPPLTAPVTPRLPVLWRKSSNRMHAAQIQMRA